MCQQRRSSLLPMSYSMTCNNFHSANGQSQPFTYSWSPPSTLLSQCYWNQLLLHLNLDGQLANVSQLISMTICASYTLQTLSQNHCPICYHNISSLQLKYTLSLSTEIEPCSNAFASKLCSWPQAMQCELWTMVLGVFLIHILLLFPLVVNGFTKSNTLLMHPLKDLKFI